jgi:hypothetical protein
MQYKLLSGATRMPRFVRWLAMAAGALLLLMALAWLAVPPIVRSQAEQRLSALLGREVSIGRVGFSPWSLELRLEQLRIGAAAGAANREPQFSIDKLRINADLRSLLRLAPVIEAIDIDAPKLRLTRLAEGRYDIDDLLARFKRDAPAPADDQPAHFALYNFRLTGGSFEFDDKPVQKQHRVQALQLSLPFLSNLPDDIAVNVEPRLAFTLDGAAFDSGAQAKPFAQDRASQLELRIADLDLARWLPYLPAGLPLRPSRGVFASQLQIRFALPAQGTPQVSLKGQATLRDAALVTGSGAGEPLAAWKQLQIGLADVQPLARRIALGTVALDGAQIELRRAADGSLNLPTSGASKPNVAAPPPASGASAAAGKKSDDAWLVSVEQIALSAARIDWRDATTQPAAALRADQLALSVQKLRWPFEAPAPLKLTGRIGSADAAEPAAFTIEGEASDRSAKASVDLQAVDLRWFAPYLAQSLTATLDGRAALAATLDWASGPQPRLALTQINASANDLRLSEGAALASNVKAAPRAPAQAAPFSLPAFALSDGSVDLLAHRVVLSSVKIDRPALRVHRNAAGQWNLLSWARAGKASTTNATADAKAPAWQVELGELQLVAAELRFHDERPNESAGAALEPVRLLASGVTASVRGLTWPGANLARTQLQLRLAADAGDATAKQPAQRAARGSANIGRIEWSGQVATAPLQARGKLRVERAPVHLFEPYFGGNLNLDLLRAEATWRGDVAVAQRSGGLEASARGDALLGDLRVNERLTPSALNNNTQGDELLSWNSFALRGLQFAMKPGAKPTLDIQEAALTDFYSRLVITEQGRFNLRDVAAAPGAAASAPSVAPTPPAPAPAASAPAAAPGSGLPIAISIGGTQLSNGKVDFTDRFIRPNYSAALTELNGRLGPFNSASAEMATLDLRGRAAGTALLEISGALNPTASPLTLDIRAKATDLELAPLSPYAGRYAGYGIERGKLSMDIAYKIDPDGKLDAKNQVILNQLTFGDKVESPDATKLPVLLVVALLKDRNGVIDINLPVSGSINDPQFSIFGIVLKIIGNLLVKALTAPFALLAGGGSDDLSFVGFEAGTASFTDSGRATLDKVAKALSDRPALKMTVTGASDPASEREATQKAAVDARVRTEQRREALRGGAAADAPLPPLSATQREAIVRRIYSDTSLPNKPRNVIGLSKDIPVTEMETLLRNATVVSSDTARELALQRGLAVRDALIAKGLPSERLFLAAPKLRASGEEDAAWSPRVQLALSTN